MDVDILEYWELHIMSKEYNMDADILGRQEPHIISKSYIDNKKEPYPYSRKYIKRCTAKD
jgi:hypothetical protein